MRVSAHDGLAASLLAGGIISPLIKVTTGRSRPNAGDGANALELAGLFTQPLAALNGQTFNAFCAESSAQLGGAIQTAQDRADDGLAVVNMLKDSIQSESGINLDQELVDMLTSQRAYQAASRLLNVVDGMLDTIINRMG